MGRNLQQTQTGSSPGCVWGVLHVLKYHHWRYVQKRFPHRRSGPKHATQVGNEGDTESPVATGKSQLHTNAARGKAAVEGKASESPSGKKGSVKSRLKALISDEISKRRGKHRRSTSCPVQTPLPSNGPVLHCSGTSPQVLIKTGSLRDTVHDNIGGGDDATSDDTPELPSYQEQDYEELRAGLAGDQLKHHKVMENGKQIVEAEIHLQDRGDKRKEEEQNIGAKTHQAKEVMDALEMINMNKELFLRMLHDPGSPLAYHFHKQQARSKRKMWSKSFSLPSSLRRGDGNNKNKQKEGSDSPVKEGNSRVGGQIVQRKSKRYFHSLSMPSATAMYRGNGIPKLDQSMVERGEIPFLGSSQNLKDHGLDQVASKRSKSLKQRITQVIKENKKEKQRITRDGILHKVPYSKMFSKDLKKELARRLKESPMSQSSNDIHVGICEAKNSLPRTSKPAMRRTPSLRESLARYNKLYDSILEKEAKPHDSENLNRKKQDDLSSPLRVKKTMGRVFSLPDIRFSSYQLEQHSDMSSSSQDKTAADSTVSLKTDLAEPRSKDPELVIEAENSSLSDFTGHAHEDSIENGNIGGYMGIDHPESPPAVSEIEGGCQVVSGLVNFAVEHAQLDVQVRQPCVVPVMEADEPATELMPEPMLLEVATSLASTSFSEAQGIAVKILPPNVVDSFSDQSSESYLDTPATSESGLDQRTEPDNKSQDKEELLVHLQIQPKDKAEFNYVRRILELSGFSGTDQLLGTWYSDDQPLDPSLVYEEMEGPCSCMVLDPECGANEQGGSCHHLILFDLINEVLMETYSKSYSYYPRQLSSLACIRPMPVGHRVLEEVWSEISWNLSSCPEGEHFLDYAVRKDLTRRDGWMNLQFDSECVGLEIEELIFDDVLEDLVGECYEEYYEAFVDRQRY